MKFKLGILIMRIGAKLAGVRYVDIQYDVRSGEGKGEYPYNWTTHKSMGFVP